MLSEIFCVYEKIVIFFVNRQTFRALDLIFCQGFHSVIDSKLLKNLCDELIITYFLDVFYQVVKRVVDGLWGIKQSIEECRALCFITNYFEGGEEDIALKNISKQSDCLHVMKSYVTSSLEETVEDRMVSHSISAIAFFKCLEKNLCTRVSS
jgi:hypothetical protein